MPDSSDDISSHTRAVLELTEEEFDNLVNAVGTDSVNEFVNVIQKLIKADRIPTVIRQPGGGWLKGRSLLEVFRTEGIESINCYIERLRSWIPE